jgi:hypothetical protein
LLVNDGRTKFRRKNGDVEGQRLPVASRRCCWWVLVHEEKELQKIIRTWPYYCVGRRGEENQRGQLHSTAQGGVGASHGGTRSAQGRASSEDFHSETRSTCSCSKACANCNNALLTCNRRIRKELSCVLYHNKGGLS